MDKKIDYFGRELNTGDIVVIQHKSKMEIGVCLDSKIRTSSTIDYASSSKYIYKLENPTQDEIAESRKIIKDYNTLQLKKKAAQKAKGHPGQLDYKFNEIDYENNPELAIEEVFSTLSIDTSATFNILTEDEEEAFLENVSNLI